MAEVRVASRFQGPQNTCYMTREADLVQLVQEGQRGGGQGANQPEALPPGHRPWPIILKWTGCQDSASECLWTRDWLVSPLCSQQGQHILQIKERQSCFLLIDRELWGAMHLLGRDPTIGGVAGRSPSSFCSSGSLERVALQMGESLREIAFSLSFLLRGWGRVRIGCCWGKLWPDFSCPGSCRRSQAKVKAALGWVPAGIRMGHWCQRVGFSLGEPGLRGGVREACSLVLLLLL